jgi:uncharacterized protein (DUF305 family)
MPPYASTCVKPRANCPTRLEGGTRLAALEAASVEDASSLFLEQMIMHHTGAIGEAQQEPDNGENADARELASPRAAGGRISTSAR